MQISLIALFACLALLSACQPATQVIETSTPSPAPSQPPAPSTTPAFTPAAQTSRTRAAYGPELEDFPAGINPLTALPVEDPAWLQLPAVLVSISNMPVTARPQAGINFAPWIFEIYIGEGTTRFMGVFYGDYPRLIPNVTGDCPVRTDILHPNGLWVGNRAWLDENANGRQDAWEVGVGGICVLLYRDGNYEQFWATSTDSNGYFAFSLPAEDAGQPLNTKYTLQFEIPASYTFTTPNVGNDDEDSDADPATGRTPAFTADAADSSWDAGLIPSEVPTATPKPIVTGTPPGWYIPNGPYVGPIRSGRLTYNHFGDMFPNSCLVYASAGRGIREALNGCEIIFGVDQYDPNSALLTVDHLRELAQKKQNPRQPVNYSGNRFDDVPPPGGAPAENLYVFFHSYSQTLWQYDPVSGAYLRQTDNADGKSNFHPATDRLTDRQQSFANVIVLYADYQVVRYLQYDIDLSLGQKGKGWLFRDGQVYPIYWSTRSRDYEKKTGLLRPMYFLDSNGDPIPLKPGQTWIHLMTEASYLDRQPNGVWRAVFAPPYDPR